MAPERVRKLIEGRTGPITRALRADKADAIAQTFEAAGVRVIIRSAEFEELDDLQASVVGKATAERAALRRAGGETAVDGAAGAVPGFVEDPEPAPEPVAEPEPERAPALSWASEPGPSAIDEPEPEPEPEPIDPEARSVADAAPWRGAAHAPDDGSGFDDAPDDDAPDDELDERAAFAAELGDPEPDGSDEGDDGPHLEADIVAVTNAPVGWAAPDEARPAADPKPLQAQRPARVRPFVVTEPTDLDDFEGEGDEDDDGPAARGELSSASRSFSSTGEWVAGDAGVWSTSRTERTAAESAAYRNAAASIDDGLGEGDDLDAAPVVGRGSRRSRLAPRVEEAAPTPDPVVATRPVPIAWRGLGPELAGPARPVDAPVPRRHDPDAPIDIPDPRQRRRGLMLVLLAVAVVGFVLSQWWVASRAGAAVDATAGFHAYRDGDFDAARRYWGAQASAGDPAAQFMLGYMAEAGLGAPWSARAASAWYRAAAEGGHAEAAWRLGLLYETGLGVAPDDAEARRWFRHASDLGHAEAAFAWARSWMRALGVQWAHDGAPVWPAGVVDELSVAFERAAALGFHEAAPYAASLAAARANGLP